MFIKWRTLKKPYGDLYVACVVESRRIDTQPRHIHRGYLGSIRAEDVHDGEKRLAFWDALTLASKRQRLHLTSKMEDTLRARVPKGVKDKDCWMTREADIASVRQVFGCPIDLDVASSDFANLTVGALRYFTPGDDALRANLPWTAPTVFMNPPFNNAQPWVEKLVYQYNAGNIGEAVFILLATAAASAYAKPLRTHPDYAAWMPPRMHFDHERKASDSGSPKQVSVVGYLGKRKERFYDVFRGA